MVKERWVLKIDHNLINYMQGPWSTFECDGGGGGEGLGKDHRSVREGGRGLGENNIVGLKWEGGGGQRPPALPPLCGPWHVIRSNVHYKGEACNVSLKLSAQCNTGDTTRTVTNKRTIFFWAETRWQHPQPSLWEQDWSRGENACLPPLWSDGILCSALCGLSFLVVYSASRSFSSTNLVFQGNKKTLTFALHVSWIFLISCEVEHCILGTWTKWWILKFMIISFSLFYDY